ncbi:MAG: ATP-binding protein [Paracoccus sp. (in: a-proteobacteria)]|nr:ATP-binding protein [Paracoccus sp. (in: a-proteobacteria)]
MARQREKPVAVLRTSVRLSLQFSFLYAILSGIVFAIAYWLTQYEVQDWVQDQMRGDAQKLLEIHDSGGAVDLIDKVDALAEVSFENSRIYQLQDSAGAILSGNIAQPMGTPLPAWIPATELRLTTPMHDEVERYWMQEIAIGPYRLIQGSGDHLVAEILEALGAALVLGYLAVILLGLIAGARVGRITEERISTIQTTLSQVSAGQLDARVPVSAPAGDDLSRVSVRINAMLDQITRLLESQQQISNDIAHDMRTPLQRLHQRLERMINAEAVTSEDVQGSLQQTQDIITTFNALLRIAQLEGDHHQMQAEPTDLALILSNVAELFEPVAEDQGIALGMALPPEPLEVTGDPGLLTQLFSNLVENAIKHCPSGTTVEIAARIADDDIIVRVADDGPGIEKANRERIFRRFFRVENSRNLPGNGLGLALVKAIAEMHGAAISVHDNHPGAVFEVRLARSGQADIQ